MLLGPRQPAGLAQDHGSRAEINRDATLGTVQTVTGNVAQDYSRNLMLYNNAFRVEVVRATDEASAAKQQVRDQILTVLDGLVGEVGARSLSDEQARTLGRRLGTILDAAPISPYQLQAREFTLKPGTAYFLPGGADSFTYAWIQLASATFDLKAAISSAMVSAGVFHPSVLRGRPFMSRATSLSQV